MEIQFSTNKILNWKSSEVNINPLSSCAGKYIHELAEELNCNPILKNLLKQSIVNLTETVKFLDFCKKVSNQRAKVKERLTPHELTEPLPCQQHPLILADGTTKTFDCIDELAYELHCAYFQLAPDKQFYFSFSKVKKTSFQLNICQSIPALYCSGSYMVGQLYFEIDQQNGSLNLIRYIENSNDNRLSDVRMIDLVEPVFIIMYYVLYIS